jgi:hypothetical protein
MTVDQVLRNIGLMTTDSHGQIGRFSFRQGQAVGLVEARLDKSGGPSPSLWRIIWDVQWRSAQGQEQRESSPDLRAVLARFPQVDLQSSSALSLDEVE